MKEITLPIMFNILKEMLGGMFLPLIFISFFAIFAFIAILIMERKFYCKRAIASLIVGLFGGIIVLFWFKGFSVSPSIIVISAPIDLILLKLNYFGGVFMSAVLVYTFIGFAGRLKKNGCPIDRRLR